MYKYKYKYIFVLFQTHSNNNNKYYSTRAIEKIEWMSEWVSDRTGKHDRMYRWKKKKRKKRKKIERRKKKSSTSNKNTNQRKTVHIGRTHIENHSKLVLLCMLRIYCYSVSNYLSIYLSIYHIHVCKCVCVCMVYTCVCLFNFLFFFWCVFWYMWAVYKKRHGLT